MAQSPRPNRVPTQPPTDAEFRSVVESTADFAIFLLDRDGYVRSWNPGAQRIKGWTADEIVGYHFSRFYPADDLAWDKPLYELRVASDVGRFEDLGWRVRKDGSMFWANVVITALRDARGEVTGFAKITRDITDRKQAEEATRASEERYRLLLDSVKDYAIFLLDADGRVVSWNEGAHRLKGYTRDQIFGRHFSIFYSEEDRAAHLPERALAAALREGRWENEGWRVRKDGSRFWADVVIAPVRSADGRLVGFSKVTRDLSERRRAAATIERGERRVRHFAVATKEMEAFTYTVAHDLRAPLRAILSLADHVLTEAGPRLGDETEETLRIMRRSAERANEIVEDMLKLAGAGNDRPAPQRVDVTHLARHILNGLARRDAERRVEWEVEEGLAAEADPRLLRLALENLLSNAWKFTSRTANPSIHVGRAQLGDGPAFFVRDNGAGFDPRRAGELFEPFRRLHSQAEFEGTGVGLAIVRRVVERHGGEVWAEAAPNEGATFWFRLPGA